MTGTLQILIVDDEPFARRALELLLRDQPGVAVAAAASDGIEALGILASERIDLMLADIEMPQVGGLELVKRLPTASLPLVIFVTAHMEYAVQAFELGAADYLLKPVSPDRLSLALDRARVALAAPRSGFQDAVLWRSLAALRSPARAIDHLWLDVRGGRERVDVDQIEQLHAEDDYVRVVTAGRSYLTYGPLDMLATKLAGAGFLRVHRSTIVRIASVRAVRVDTGRRLVLIMASGEEISVGRRSSASVRSALQH